MTFEESIGHAIEALRSAHGMTQTELGRRLEPYLGAPWSRQAVSAAGKGQRAFTAAELIALATVLDTTVMSLLKTTEPVTLPSGDKIDPDALSEVLDGAPSNDDVRTRMLWFIRLLAIAVRDSKSRSEAQTLILQRAEAALLGRPDPVDSRDPYDWDGMITGGLDTYAQDWAETLKQHIVVGAVGYEDMEAPGDDDA